jgi:1-acyl-sn-glycerol-3-phosphate acyltransferase
MEREAIEVRPPRRWELVFYAVIRAILFAFSRTYFRLRVIDGEKVPASGPFVLAPVHRSNIDFLLVSAVTRRRMRYMGKDSIWKWELPGRLISALGAFPVRRGTADRDALRTCMAVVEVGEPLVMFPEGTRQSGPIVQPLFDGPAYVAARAGIPIVPVGIGGSEAAMPRGSKMIRPTRIVLVVGDPIHPPAPSESGARVPRRVVRELTDTLHVEVQKLFDAAQARVS